MKICATSSQPAASTSTDAGSDTQPEHCPMAYAIKSHRLQADGSSVPFRATPNKGGAIKPEVIVLHDTAGRIAVGSVVGSARSI
jgi:hypothetical protein